MTLLLDSILSAHFQGHLPSLLQHPGHAAKTGVGMAINLIQDTSTGYACFALVATAVQVRVVFSVETFDCLHLEINSSALLVKCGCPVLFRKQK